ncbi:MULTISPECIES: DUF4307 domain-containing protein [unclassified Nocardia]|uniref:DUF4307 domain-containing protein n=1 Tax=unclassified Nocardia TaxID=2637762 RepID=UPI001CE44438|nr:MULTISPECIES: DUF4307 domain-containing protein [unclassified Nocardia]
MTESAGGTDLRADRYGIRPRVRRRWIPLVLGVIVLLAGFGVAYAYYQNFGPSDIDPEQLGYVVDDDSTITVHLKVTRKNPEQPVVCWVRAMSRDGSEVGRREVLIEPSSSGTVELTTVVKASARPSAGNIYGCSSHVPGYLRAG